MAKVKKEPTYQYDAFISYNRQDKDFAVNLEGALEDYKSPEDLALPQRNLKIFRDVSDMIGTDYYKSIEGQLEKSKKLIVICTPKARKSEFVNDEIRRFSEKSSSDNIIPILLEGIPNNEAKAGQEDEMAFPQALCDVMELPLAINYVGFNPLEEKVNKGTLQDSWYTLLANMYDISRDEIEQRDKERQRRLDEQMANEYWERSVVERKNNRVLESLHFLAAAASITPDKKARKNMLLDIESFLPQFRLSHIMKHDAPVFGLRLNKDETRILSWDGEGGNTAKLWDAKTGEAVGIRIKHDAGIWGAAFSQDEHFVLTWSSDGSARMWDAKTGHPVGVPLRNEGPVHNALLNPDGSRVLTWSDIRPGVQRVTEQTDKSHAARLWDVTTGIGVQLFLTNDWTNAIFSNDGALVLAWLDDSTVKLWHGGNGEPLDIVIRHDDRIYGAAFYDEASKIVTWGADKTVRLWSVETGQPVHPPLRHQGYVFDVAFNRDETRMLTRCADSTARIWDPHTGALLIDQIRHDGELLGTQFNEDETRILVWSKDQTARVWDAQTGQPLSPPLQHDEEIRGVIFSPDGAAILTRGDTAAKLWDTQSGELLITPLSTGGSDSKMFSPRASFNKDGTLILTEGFDWESNIFTAKIWDAKHGRQLHPSLQNVGAISAAFFSKDGRQIFTKGADKTIKIWERQRKQPSEAPVHRYEEVYRVTLDEGRTRIFARIDQGTARYLNPFNGQPTTASIPISKGVGLNKAGTQIITFDGDGTVCVWDAKTGAQLVPPLQHPGDVLSVTISYDETRILTVCRDNAVRQWDARTGDRIGEPMRHDAQISGAAYDIQGTHVLTWYVDGTLRLWDAATGKPIRFFLQHDNIVSGAVFNSDGSKVLSWGLDNTIRLWSTYNGEEIISSLKHSVAERAGAISAFSSVVGAVFNKAETQILTWGGDHTVRLWNAQTGEQIVWPMQHAALVYGAIFSRDEIRILSWSGDKTVRQWDAEKGRQIGAPLQHDGPVRGASYNSDGTQILTWSDDNTTKLWDAQTGYQIGPAIQHSPREDGVKGGLLGAVFNEEEDQVLTFDKNGTAKVWEVKADLDLPTDKLMLQLSALTGIELDTRSREIRILDEERLYDVQREYFEVGKQHEKVCQYPERNVWRRFFSANMRFDPKEKRPLRSVPIPNLSEEEVATMLVEKGLHDVNLNKKVPGFNNHFEGIKEDPVIQDQASGLMWERSGTDSQVNYHEAMAYVDNLNKSTFAGYTDWRLPTLEEAMSLMEMEKKNDDLHIDPLFDTRQQWIWTSDRENDSIVWMVSYGWVSCSRNSIRNTPAFVRAVRSSELVSAANLPRSKQEPVGDFRKETGSVSFDEDLLRAVRNHNIEALRVALKNGANVNKKDVAGASVLMIASNHNYTTIVQALLDAGADVNADASDGATALIAAAGCGHTTVANMLLAHGAEVNKKDKKGWTALYWVAEAGHTTTAQALLTKDADANAETNDGLTPLMVATSQRHTPMVQTLLAKKSDPNIRSKDGWTALRVATYNGYADIVEALLAKGADVNTKTKEGETPLITAAKQGHIGILKTLLNYRADVNAQTQHGYTALMLTGANGETRVIKFLLANGANINAKLENGQTVLTVAAYAGHAEVVQVLLANGADVNAKDKAGETALTIAAYQGHAEVVKVLLENGAEVNEETKDGGTALRYATYAGYAEVVKGLLENGADVNEKTPNGETALMIAAYAGHAEVVKVLLANGADLNAYDNRAWTALMIAASEGHADVVKVLLANDVDIYAEDGAGSTALMIAEAQGHTRVIRLLENAMAHN